MLEDGRKEGRKRNSDENQSEWLYDEDDVVKNGTQNHSRFWISTSHSFLQLYPHSGLWLAGWLTDGIILLCWLPGYAVCVFVCASYTARLIRLNEVWPSGERMKSCLRLFVFHLIFAPCLVVILQLLLLCHHHQYHHRLISSHLTTPSSSHTFYIIHTENSQHYFCCCCCWCCVNNVTPLLLACYMVIFEKR